MHIFLRKLLRLGGARSYGLVGSYISLIVSVPTMHSDWVTYSRCGLCGALPPTIFARCSTNCDIFIFKLTPQKYIWYTSIYDLLHKGIGKHIILDSGIYLQALDYIKEIIIYQL